MFSLIKKSLSEIFISPGGVFGKLSGGVKGIFGKGKEGEAAGAEKEHGNFDFFGRDAVRKVGGLASKAGKKIGEWVSSTISDGLDVSNGTFFGGAVDLFKEHVRAIYPGEKQIIFLKFIHSQRQ